MDADAVSMTRYHRHQHWTRKHGDVWFAKCDMWPLYVHALLRDKKSQSSFSSDKWEFLGWQKWLFGCVYINLRRFGSMKAVSSETDAKLHTVWDIWLNDGSSKNWNLTLVSFNSLSWHFVFVQTCWQKRTNILNYICTF